ncbi:MAG: hypothetical protein A2W00_05860 [Candidatus Eisenbacteria bacterium RBG_16_71_46]|nr:MAG: hypothetical protein A2W00_05860 [Candidatus Eisenbacteria bacterium RBG_16_71_46]
MNLGELLLVLAVATALASSILFFAGVRGRAAPAAARWAFAAHAGALVVALVTLCALFLAHRFEYAYVAQYSSRALSPALTLAATWAGQEGSILLWAAFGALIGLALLRQPGRLAQPAMFFVSLTQAALVGLLLIRSPFARNAIVPADGLGLNPLLEDPWMVVHPPVLFLGYAALMVPFALTAAALARKDYANWPRMVWPWSLFAVVTLGAGIALGGIWAYKVLGWGGYWGWDPVENASLIPWLVSVALLHGLLIQRTTGAAIRTSLALGIVAWVTVLGGTYLTRSGVLQDFSVHSFADSGINGPLIGILLGTTLTGAGLLVARWRTIATRDTTSPAVSRESALWLGLGTVLVLAALVTLGTTAPLLTAIAGKPAAVSTKFYEQVSLPLGIALVLLMAVAPALRWSRQRGVGWIAAMAPGLIAAVVLSLVAFLAGVREQAVLALTAFAGLALGVNAAVTVKHFRRGWAFGAGYLGHVGVAVAVLGMVISSALGRSERVTLSAGTPVQALGYTLTYQGTTPGPRGERVMAVHVARGNWSFEARPTLIDAPRNEGMMRKPAIHGWRDIYLSPLDLVKDEARTREPLWLNKGQEVRLGNAGITFTGFHMTSHEDMEVRADLAVRSAGVTFAVSPGMRAGAKGNEAIPALIPGVGTVTIASIDADNGRVALEVPETEARAQAALLEFSTKPMVNLVWMGALLALIGSGLAGIRRAAEQIPGRLRGATPSPSRQA